MCFLNSIGNILIGKSSKRPVLLDFGLTKEVTDDIRFNFAKLIVAANEQGIDVAIVGVSS